MHPVRLPSQSIPRHHTHPRHRRGASGFTPRSLLLGLLILATIGTGVWWVALRGAGTELSRDFVRVEERFVAAARAIPDSVIEVTHTGALIEWNKGVDAHLAEMQREIRYLRVVAREAEGRARTIAQEAVETANFAYTLAENYRYEINSGRNLTNAANASRAMFDALDELGADARTWKTLQGA